MARAMVRLSMLVALAIALHVLEAQFPSPFVIPGAKLGLANVATVVAIALGGWRQGLAVALFRTTLGALVTGTLFSFSYLLSFGGAVVAALVMGAMHRLEGYFSLIGVSLAGAVAHNVAQVSIAAYLVRQVGILFYLPYLLLFAVPTGFFTGLVATYLVRALWGRLSLE